MKGAALAKALASPDPAIRCYLFYGADEAGSRAHARRLAAAFGDGVERIDLAPGQLRADPALLADEAASASLFGDARYIRVEGAGDESLAAVEALMTAPAAGNPVVLIAGALRKDARLIKRLDGDRAAIVAASFVPEGAEAVRLAISLAREVGLLIDEEPARGLAEAAAGDRSILASELEKLALYADADPARPVRVIPAMIDAIGIDAIDADVGAAVNALFSGDIRALDRELSTLTEADAIMMVRASGRRALAMAAVRAEMDRGVPVGSALAKAGPGLFWRDRDAVGRDIVKWSAPRISAVVDRLGSMERALKSSKGAAHTELSQSLVAMTRSVKR